MASSFFRSLVNFCSRKRASMQWLVDRILLVSFLYDIEHAWRERQLGLSLARYGEYSSETDAAYSRWKISALAARFGRHLTPSEAGIANSLIETVGLTDKNVWLLLATKAVREDQCRQVIVCPLTILKLLHKLGLLVSGIAVFLWLVQVQTTTHGNLLTMPPKLLMLLVPFFIVGRVLDLYLWHPITILSPRKNELKNIGVLVA